MALSRAEAPTAKLLHISRIYSSIRLAGTKQCRKSYFLIEGRPDSFIRSLGIFPSRYFKVIALQLDLGCLKIEVKKGEKVKFRLCI